MSVGNLSVREIEEHKSTPKKSRKRGTILFFVAGAVVCIAITLLSRHLRSSHTQVLQPPSPAQAERTVSLLHPEKGSSTVNLDLRGQLQAYTDAPIFAPTSGYLNAGHLHFM